MPESIQLQLQRIGGKSAELSVLLGECGDKFGDLYFRFVKTVTDQCEQELAQLVSTVSKDLIAGGPVGSDNPE